MSLAKPAGIGSFAALGGLKRALGTRKVGHTGTLDRFATGVLIALVGPMARLAWLVTELPKTYRATIRFGQQTTTLDPTGDLERSCPVPDLSVITEALPHFLGDVRQSPPAYSAVHIDGVRASTHARQGRKIEPVPRLVRIDDLTIVAYKPPDLKLLIVCGKGTYVRSLARDIGAAVHSCAYVHALCREAVGRFTLGESVPVDEVTPEHVLEPAQCLSLLPNLATVQVTTDGARRVIHGQPLRRCDVKDAVSSRLPHAVLDGERLLAVVEPSDDLSLLRYRCVLASA